MNEFCELYWQLDSTTKTNEKVAYLSAYFQTAAPADAAWATYFLTGKRVRRLVPMKLLRSLATEEANIKAWLFEECYHRVGDLAETISLVVPAGKDNFSLTLCDLVEHHLLPLQGESQDNQRQRIRQLWRSHSRKQVFVLSKLMTGAFRIGVSAKLVHRAMAHAFDLPATTITHRLMGDWEPSEEFFDSLKNPVAASEVASQPFPFFLANAIKDSPNALGTCKDWLAEWKWDGIRAQVIHRNSETFIWSRGEDLVNTQFPEIVEAANHLPNGTVLDGELLAWNEETQLPLSFSALQKRLGRKKVGDKLRRAIPVTLIAFDLLEHSGQDIREKPLVERQTQLSQVLSNLPSIRRPIQKSLFSEMDNEVCGVPAIQTTGLIRFESWEQLQAIRKSSGERKVEGVMLKRASSTYQVGRPVGDWWKWKVDPFTVDAVLIYAQRGHGRRANLYSDYTFAVWKAGELVPFAKAYSGLTDEEMRKVDAFIKSNTRESFGPVRSVEPEMVFELAFENIQRSSRHKSGIAVRFPRISRWRHDKAPKDADNLDSILAMLDS